MVTILSWLPGLLLVGQPGAQSERLWQALGKDDPTGALAAVAEMAARPEQALPLLRERLKPDPRSTPEDIRRLIADLDSSRFAVREKAGRALATLGTEALPALRQTLEDRPPLEVRRRIELLLIRIEQPVVLDTQQLREVRAVQVLERIGNAEARQLLQRLADGAPGSRLTQEARSAVERLRPRAR